MRVELNGVVAVFHRPHPEKEASKGRVKAAREFLKKAGVEPRRRNIRVILVESSTSLPKSFDESLTLMMCFAVISLNLGIS